MTGTAASTAARAEEPGIGEARAAYLADAGTQPARLSRSRSIGRFVIEFGDVSGWRARSVPERLAAGDQARAFAHFAVVHARVQVEAEYVAAVTSRWGHHVATRDPEQADQFRFQAASLDFDRLEIDKMWSRLAQICVITGSCPDELSGNSYLAGAGRHPGRRQRRLA
jgi:hypothetical protein